MMSLEHGLFDLAVVSLIAALTPLVVGLLPRLRVAQVVILILGGIVVGPQVLGWADPGSIELFSNLGLGFLFLLAGYELDLGLFWERSGRLAIMSWLVTALVAIAVTGALAAVGFIEAFMPIAIGLTTTALGHPAADPAGEPDAAGPVRQGHHGRRSGWGVLSHRRHRGVSRHPGRLSRV
jgi:Kef-type K+ transport system membrane component KefB